MNKVAELSLMAGFLLFAAGAIIPGFAEPLMLAVSLDETGARILSTVLCMATLGVLVLGRIERVN